MENDELINLITREVLYGLYSNKTVNWDTIENSDFDFGGELKKISSQFNNINIDIYQGCFKKNQRLKKHLHKNPTQEIYFILEGYAEIHIENEIIYAKKGDFLCIPAEKIHWPVNKNNEDLKILFFLFPREIEGPLIFE